MRYLLRGVSAVSLYTWRIAKSCARAASFPFVTLILVLSALAARATARPRATRDLRLVWGPAPIINNTYWSRAMSEGGWHSETYTESYAAAINERKDYDKLVEEELGWIKVRHLRLVAAFITSLFHYDIFVTSFNGYFLGLTEFWRLESQLLQIARKKIVVIPFGGDAFVYRRVRSTALAHGLMSTLPGASRQQRKLAAKVDYWCDCADIVVPATMGPDGIGRWDVITPSTLCVDLSRWRRSNRINSSDGCREPVVVTHSPNFRGFKGSEFLIGAIGTLQAEGLNVELRLVEGVQNREVRRILAEESDILVEQLIATGHGLNGVEGLASGLPVICNLEDEAYTLMMKRWSFLGECPIVSATPETLTSVLRDLITDPARRRALGLAGRAYVENYHSAKAFRTWFERVIEKLYDSSIDTQDIHRLLKGRDVS